MIDTLEKVGTEVEVFENLEEFKTYFTYQAVKYIIEESLPQPRNMLVTFLIEEKQWIFKTSSSKYILIEWWDLDVSIQDEIWNYCLNDITSEIEKRTNKRPTLKIENVFPSDEDGNGSSLVIIDN